MTLDEHWVPQDPDSKEPNGYYNPGKGVEDRNGRTVHFEVRDELVKGVNTSHFPTQRRVDVVLRGKITEPTDRTVVCIAGWGETSAIFTGERGLAEVLMEATEKEGSKNPALIFPNTGGRGTRLSAWNNSASATPFRAGMEDARRLAKELVEREELNGPVSVIGHSMGYMGAWSFVEGLLEEKAKNPKAPFHLQSITGLMPATDEAMGTLSWRFDKAVLPHVWPAVKACRSGKSLRVTPEEYNALMYGNAQHPDRENYKRSVPDSGRVFLEWAAMNFARKPLPANGLNGVRANILWAGQEGLLPDKMGVSEARFLHDNGRKKGMDVSYHTLQNFSHAIPYEMSEEQKKELLGHWVSLI